MAAELGLLFQLHTLITNAWWKAYAAAALARAIEGTREAVPAVDLAGERKQLRGIKARSKRAGATLRLARLAIARGELDFARDVVAEIEPMLFWQRGQLALARGYFEHGRVRDALRIVRNARDHRVVAERQNLLCEIRLAIRPHTERGVARVVTRAQLRAARPAPSWTEIEEVATVKQRDFLCAAVAYARSGRHDARPYDFEEASWYLVDAGSTRATRRAFVAIAERSHVDVVDALIAMRPTKRGRIVDGFLAEYIAMRAETLGELPAPLRAGLANIAPTSQDARSLERALYDEGVALGPNAAQRRRVLIATAQTCLRSAIAEPDHWSPEVIDARLRTLVHLGGSLGAETLEKALAAMPATCELFARVLGALCLIDSRTAARVALRHRPRDSLLQTLEIRGGVPRGFARAYRSAYASLVRQHGEVRACQWLVELVQLWHLRVGTLPDPIAFDRIARRTHIPERPHKILDELDVAGAEIVLDAHDRIIRNVAAERSLLDALLLARPARVDPRMTTWTDERWLDLFAAITARTDFVEHNVLVDCARLLGLADYIPLRLGDLPRIGITPIVHFRADQQDYRLRFLDKRLDLLTYLRFADVPARSCYRSTSSYYRSSPYTERAVVVAWKDPLTFCFHVERRADDHTFTPCGFLFGSFAKLGREPAIALNSLHVRPNTEAVRISAIRAFEDALVKPLGITHVGIANRHGGLGPLPYDYQPRRETITRLRALARGDRLVTTAYDDIAATANVPDVVYLSWKSVR